ncbi:hypothetical protein GF325_18285 [Candidatus Bathyarchaeota archaeon]|nr:hypothetical protein [Candidatus Bathyarchaeota archaeon]
MGSISSSKWLDLVDVFNYIEINGDIDDNIVLQLAEEMNLNHDFSEIKIKSHWHKFKQFSVYNIDDEPFLFIKELWQPEFFREILGIHIGTYFLDKELGVQDYLFGTWRKNRRKEKPILVTPYVRGKKLKGEEHGYMFGLGRQYAYHEVLSLYDVDWRHFIIQQGIVVRIDFGRSFSNLDMPYQGFWDIGYDKKLSQNAEFNRGVRFEMDRIAENIAKNRHHLSFLLDKMRSLESGKNFFIDFDMNIFLDELTFYWNHHVSIPVLEA